MYYVVMDSKTESFFMKPRECSFYAYSDIEDVIIPPNSSKRLVETECEEQKELTTMMYNAGFKTGYIDNQSTILTKEDAYK